MARLMVALGALFGAVIALLAALPGAVPAEDTIRIDGSSTVYPIAEAMAEEFQAATEGKYRVTVGISGSGGGFNKFCRGETDISNASRPIKESERTACRAAGIEFIELPAALDALAVVVNPQNDWVDHLTVEELRTIWEPEAQGRITSWRQVRDGFPNRPLTLYGPGVDSGTYDYFTEAVAGREGASRGDFTASEDDNVLVQGIATDPNALGFFGFAYYDENRDKLRPVPISWRGGEPVEPSLEAARDGSYQPLSRPLLIYVNRRAADEREAVRAFVEFVLDPAWAEEIIEEVGYVPLPDEAYRLALDAFRVRATGTAFAGGAQVGVSVEDLLAAERTN